MRGWIRGWRMIDEWTGGRAVRRSGGRVGRGSGRQAGGRAVWHGTRVRKHVTLSAAKGGISRHGAAHVLCLVFLLAFTVPLPAQSLPRRLDAHLDAPPYDRQ